MSILTKTNVWDAVVASLPTLARDFLVDVSMTGDKTADVKLKWITDVGKAAVEAMAPGLQDAVRRKYAGMKEQGDIPKGVADDVSVRVSVEQAPPPELPESAPPWGEGKEPAKKEPETPPSQDDMKKDAAAEAAKAEQAKKEAAEAEESKKDEDKKTVSVMDLQWMQSMSVYSASGSLQDYLRWVAQLVSAELRNRASKGGIKTLPLPERADKAWLDGLLPVVVKLPTFGMDVMFGPTAFSQLMDVAYAKLAKANERIPMYLGTLRAGATVGDPAMDIDPGVPCAITLFYLGAKNQQQEKKEDETK